MNTSPIIKPAVVLPLAFGGQIDIGTLEAIVGALKPDWNKLTQEQKIEAKLLAANMLAGNAEATQRFHDLLLIWFPIPIPPFPPIIWDQATVGTFVAHIAVGLILIGIGLMLL